jgi:pyridoxamine 5'-phosphate oxidase
MSADFGPVIVPPAKPFGLFAAWLDEAKASEPNDPNAMTLASVGSDGQPSARMVLLKEYDARGLVFYTNSQSHKGNQLAQCSKAALLFHWKSLRRQVRFEGEVSLVAASEADAYFASRPRLAQIGAWASAQSRLLGSRTELEQAVAEVTARYDGAVIPRPPHWLGYRLAPHRIEFWQEQPYRLHDRVLYTRAMPNGDWTYARLYP